MAFSDEIVVLRADLRYATLHAHLTLEGPISLLILIVECLRKPTGGLSVAVLFTSEQFALNAGSITKLYRTKISWLFLLSFAARGECE